MTVRGNRRKSMRMKVIALDMDECQVFWMPDSSNWMENILECAHIIPRRPNAPELDEPWNVILVKRYIHSWMDGRTRPPHGMTGRQFKISMLEKLKQERPSHFRWQRALDEIKRKEPE